MAATSYSYSISTDFPNGQVALSKLQDEIRASTIIIAISHIDSAGDDCDIWFKDILSTGDKASLDSIVAAHDGIIASEPEVPVDPSNKPLVVTDRFQTGHQTHWAGCNDDLASGKRFQGSMFKISETTAGEFEFVCRFKEHIHIAGAEAYCWEGAAPDDWVMFDIYAPPTVGVSNVGAGVFDKYNLGGPYNMFVPNATMQGDWDLDLAETYNSNVDFLKVVPVPASGDGFFDYNQTTEAMTVNPLQQGSHNLFDFEICLSEKVSKRHLKDKETISFIDENVQTKPFYPHWGCRVTIHNSAAKLLTVTWDLYTGRYNLQSE